MASVLTRGKYLYVQFWDADRGVTRSLSTGFLDTQSNRVKVQKMAKELQETLTKKNRERKGVMFRKKTIRNSLDHFLKMMSQSHPKTLKDIQWFLKKFLAYFRETDPVTVITKLSVEDFLMEIKKLDLKQNTIHAYGKRLNHFLNFLFEYDYIPMFKINRNIKTRPELVEKIVIKSEHFNPIFGKLSQKNSNFVTLICLLAYTGLRSSDVMDIKGSDIDLHNLVMKYYSPKRKKRKEIAIHPDLKEIILKRMQEVGKGKLLDYKNVENINRAVTSYFKQIGISGSSYTARTFRKTFITLCRNVYKMDPTIVRELVGHEHGNTTDRFYNKVTLDIQHEELLKFRLPILEWINAGKKNGNNSEVLQPGTKVDERKI